MVAYDMGDLRGVRHMFRGPKSDWSVMLLTFALTVVLDLTIAVYMGVMLASLLFMRRMSELTQICTCDGDEDAQKEHLRDVPLRDERLPPVCASSPSTAPSFSAWLIAFNAFSTPCPSPPKSAFSICTTSPPSI